MPRKLAKQGSRKMKQKPTKKETFARLQLMENTHNIINGAKTERKRWQVRRNNCKQFPIHTHNERAGQKKRERSKESKQEGSVRENHVKSYGSLACNKQKSIDPFGLCTGNKGGRRSNCECHHMPEGGRGSADNRAGCALFSHYC